jgi:hypothetical protein
MSPGRASPRLLVGMLQCPPGARAGDVCVPPTPVLTFSGSFTASFTVVAVIHSPTGAVHDCRTGPRCEIVVGDSGFDSVRTGRAPLQFAQATPSTTVTIVNQPLPVDPGPTVTAPGATVVPAGPVAATGALPRTGSDSLGLVRAGLALAALGAALVVTAWWSGRGAGRARSRPAGPRP